MPHTSEMTASSGKRLARRALLLTPWLLSFLLGAGWFLASWTPGYLERLVPRLAEDMGLPLTEFHIRQAGLFSADIGPVRLGHASQGLTLSNVRVEYTPASLKQKRVNAVVIEGLRLHASYGPEGLHIPLLDSFQTGNGNSAEKGSFPPIPFERLELRHSVLDATIDGMPLSIPLEGRINPKQKDISFSFELRPRDQRVDLRGGYAPGSGAVTLSVATRTLRIGVLNDLLPTPVKGELDLSIQAALLLGPMEQMLETAKGTIELAVRNPDLTSLGFPFEKDVALTADVAGTTVDFSLSVDDMALAGTAKAEQQSDFWNIDFEVEAPEPFSLPVDGRETTLNGLRLDAQAELKGDQVDLMLEARAHSMTAKVDETKLSISRPSLKMEGGLKNGKAALRMTAGSKGVTLGKKYRAGTARLELPLAWPAPSKGARGSLNVSDLRYDKNTAGSLRADLWQQGMGLALRGTFASGILPGLRIPFQGEYALGAGTGAVSFESTYTLPDGYDPSVLLPALEGYAVGGKADMEGELTFGPQGVSSQASLYLTGGSLDNPETGLSVTGMRLIFEVPDLLALRSAPAQLFAFERLEAGNIFVTNGRVSFQLEPNGVLLVEGGGFDWAGGTVTSRAFRVVPGRQEYDVTLLCNEIRLAEILDQLGLARAQGEAALSGELPVTWKNGQISFNGGFLHSTPGQGGVIQVEGLQSLLDSIPKGTPQRGQLELAQAAIKDFEYKWVRIQADTVGRELLVRLSVDGRPRATLPFVYRKEIGGFMQIEGDMQGSNFQGLRLDVNFNLPLDRILLYRELINMIE